MESKSKKKLKFLDKEKSEELNENILQAKDRHTEDFKLKFCDTELTWSIFLEEKFCLILQPNLPLLMVNQ